MSVIQTRVYGLKTKIVCEGDDILEETLRVLRKARRRWWNPVSWFHGIAYKDRDVLGIKESVVGRAQGNYARIDHIAEDVGRKFAKGGAAAPAAGGDAVRAKVDVIGVLFPIMSRNRFSMILKGVSRAAEKVVVQLSFPADEVGNELLEDSSVIDDLYADHTGESFTRKYGKPKHVFTEIDYIELGFSDWTGIETLTKDYNGQKIIIAVNTQFDPMHAVFNLPEGFGNPSAVIDYNKGDSISLNGRSFAQFFAPYEVKVFSLK